MTDKMANSNSNGLSFDSICDLAFLDNAYPFRSLA